ncbi:Putative uncharacterized protein [Lacticaseibacillus paracasei]|nr:Putative uncharacterized protein [Lacticaseibacillus paracasei]
MQSFRRLKRATH